MELPKKKYQIIYADPPWSYDDDFQGDSKFGGITYKTMNLDEICKLPITQISDDNCVLFIWVTMPMLEKGFEVIKSWGFEYKTCGFVWTKINDDGSFRTGIGKYTNSNVELCLIAKKGNLERVKTNIKQVIRTKITKHSAKPHEVYKRIEDLYGNIPRIELFARTKRQGWDAWGNEVPTECQNILTEVKGNSSHD